LDPLSWLLLIPIFILLGLSAFFSSTETAFACLNKYFFIVKAEKGDKKAKTIVSLYEKFDRTLISVLIGYNVCSVIISTISTVIFLKLLGPQIDNQLVSLMSSIVVALLAYIFGDSIPKVLAKNNPEKIASRNVNLMVIFIYAFYPLTLTFLGFTNLLRKILKNTPPPELTEEDFTNVVESIEAKGDLKTNESDIIQASFDFTETTVKEVLTPVSKMTMINLEGLTKAKLFAILQETNFSRIPVYNGNIDNVVGVLIVKRYFNELLKNPSISLSNCLEKPFIVTPKVMLDDLLDGFKQRRTQIALVKSNNKLLGMVTSEDVLEELVGKINETVSSGGSK